MVVKTILVSKWNKIYAFCYIECRDLETFVPCLCKVCWLVFALKQSFVSLTSHPHCLTTTFIQYKFFFNFPIPVLTRSRMVWPFLFCIFEYIKLMLNYVKLMLLLVSAPLTQSSNLQTFLPVVPYLNQIRTRCSAVNSTKNMNKKRKPILIDYQLK